MINNQNIDNTIIFILILVISAIFIRFIFQGPYITGLNEEKKDSGDDMELIFLGLGEADSIIIYHNKKTLLIDTGEVAHGPFIIKNLRKLGVEKIDYLILTHPDKDHIGGAVDIVKNFEIGVIIQSSLQEGKALQETLNQTIETKDIKSIVPEEIYQFKLGDASIKVFPPLKTSYKKDNNYSLMTLITHKDLHFYFGGDAEKKRLEEALEDELPKVTLYKLPHHGRLNSKSAEMINKLSPEFAIITGNSPSAELVEIFKSQSSKVFYTGNKNIRFLSNGVESQF